MKRTVFSVVFLFAILSIHAQQQSEEWIPASGRWLSRGVSLSQTDPTSKTARADIFMPHNDTVEISFTAKYMKGGYQSDNALAQGEIHGGFGIHIGVENPRLGKNSWGNGKSYLLWLNVDTTDWTKENRKEYTGLRAQVYRSSEATMMQLLEDRQIVDVSTIDRLTPGQYLSLDLIDSIRELSGMRVSIADVARYAIMHGVSINVRFDKRTGRISVQDPTNSALRFVFYLDPKYLQGDYISLRTNSLALRFEDVSIH